MWREKEKEKEKKVQTQRAVPKTWEVPVRVTEPPPAPEEPRPITPVIPNHLTEGSENRMSETILRTSNSGSSGQRQTLLGSSMVLKGELSGDEDLTIEGQFEGAINLKDNCVTIGQHGQVKADISARQVSVSGKLSGKVNARDKVEIRKTGNVVGDLVAMGVAIEEGAYFKGSIEILREEESTTQSQSRAAVSSWTA
jgi:cytoskeletal protein CcmA (bactofilin family)